MATLESIRNKLETKVFTALGSTVTVNHLTTSTNKWGDVTATTTVTSTVIAVPYNNIKNNVTFKPYGQLSDGEIAMVMPHDTNISVTDTVSFDSKTYNVFRIDKFPYSNGNIAFLVYLREALS